LFGLIFDDLQVVKPNPMQAVKKITLIAVILFVAALMHGCYLDDFDNIKDIQVEPISPTYGFPLINSTVSINDLVKGLGESAYVKLENEKIYITFTQSMDLDVDLSSFKIPDKQFSGTLPIVGGAAFELYEPDYVTIENDSEIKLVELKAGNLQIDFERDFIDDDMVFRIIIPSLVTDDFPDGVVISPSWNIDPYHSTATISLAGAVLNLYVDDTANGGGVKYNTFSYALEVNSTGNSSGQFVSNFSISGVEFQKVMGLINFEMDMPAQEMSLDAFSSIVDGNIYLSNPIIGFDIGTSFGVPTALEVTGIEFKNSKDESLTLQNEGIPDENTFLIGAGTKNYLPYATLEEPYEVGSYVLSGENSNVDQVLPFTPNSMSMNGKFYLGQAKEMPADPHSFFVNDTSSFDLNLNIEVPLEGSIEGLKFSYDLYDMSWPNLDDLPEIKDFDYTIELLMKTTNGIPLTFGLQTIFFDGGVVVDSLFNNVLVENIIESPEVDTQGNVGQPKEKKTTIAISKDKYEKISKAGKLQLVLQLDTGTPENREVIFKTSQELEVQLSLKVDIMIDPDI
jgi:hypothetical protein